MERIILDCDPGHDDAIAILLAAGSDAIELLGITTVAGNNTIDNVTTNAQAVCQVAGIEVPIARGASEPLVTPQIVSHDIHGGTGMDGPVLPEITTQLDPRHAVDFIIDTVMAEPAQSVTLVPVGPFTNIALAMRKEPRIVERVKRVVAMGGSYTRGNVTPSAEYNIYVDPEAAEAVFRGAWPVTMVGLDLTHQALATQELQDRVRLLDSDVARFVLDIWGFIGKTYEDVFEFPAPPVHDACCVAYLIDPSVMRVEPAHIAVELHGQWTKGMTVVNFRERAGMHHSTGVAAQLQDHRGQVATELNWPRFADLVVDAIAQLSTRTAPEHD
ncbi:purine nucleosidase [Leucobacter luti]|uniref:nucleoside hydrolase n=1 Tax=Leucobacter luti TaxID=340320 RepID=UPI0010532E09|nr:nucleoside hydrolase [Leucobacter luti]MCW2288147.1 purine nucleosidase [Leucobacter luti]TCK45691.1 purine nucleosidase [Leucobacter luti]